MSQFPTLTEIPKSPSTPTFVDSNLSTLPTTSVLGQVETSSPKSWKEKKNEETEKEKESKDRNGDGSFHRPSTLINFLGQTPSFQPSHSQSSSSIGYGSTNSTKSKSMLPTTKSTTTTKVANVSVEAVVGVHVGVIGKENEVIPIPIKKKKSSVFGLSLRRKSKSGISNLPTLTPPPPSPTPSVSQLQARRTSPSPTPIPISPSAIPTALEGPPGTVSSCSPGAVALPNGNTDSQRHQQEVHHHQQQQQQQNISSHLATSSLSSSSSSSLLPLTPSSSSPSLSPPSPQSKKLQKLLHQQGSLSPSSSSTFISMSASSASASSHSLIDLSSSSLESSHWSRSPKSFNNLSTSSITLQQSENKSLISPVRGLKKKKSQSLPISAIDSKKSLSNLPVLKNNNLEVPSRFSDDRSNLNGQNMNGDENLLLQVRTRKPSFKSFWSSILGGGGGKEKEKKQLTNLASYSSPVLSSPSSLPPLPSSPIPTLMPEHRLNNLSNRTSRFFNLKASPPTTPLPSNVVGPTTTLDPESPSTVVGIRDPSQSTQTSTPSPSTSSVEPGSSSNNKPSSSLLTSRRSSFFRSNERRSRSVSETANAVLRVTSSTPPPPMPNLKNDDNNNLPPLLPPPPITSLPGRSRSNSPSPSRTYGGYSRLKPGEKRFVDRTMWKIRNMGSTSLVIQSSINSSNNNNNEGISWPEKGKKAFPRSLNCRGTAGLDQCRHLEVGILRSKLLVKLKEGIERIELENYPLVTGQDGNRKSMVGMPKVREGGKDLPAHSDPLALGKWAERKRWRERTKSIVALEDQVKVIELLDSGRDSDLGFSDRVKWSSELLMFAKSNPGSPSPNQTISLPSPVARRIPRTESDSRVELRGAEGEEEDEIPLAILRARTGSGTTTMEGGGNGSGVLEREKIKLRQKLKRMDARSRMSMIELRQPEDLNISLNGNRPNSMAIQEREFAEMMMLEKKRIDAEKKEKERMKEERSVNNSASSITSRRRSVIEDLSNSVASKRSMHERSVSSKSIGPSSKNASSSSSIRPTMPPGSPRPLSRTDFSQFTPKRRSSSPLSPLGMHVRHATSPTPPSLAELQRQELAYQIEMERTSSSGSGSGSGSGIGNSNQNQTQVYNLMMGERSKSFNSLPNRKGSKTEWEWETQAPPPHPSSALRNGGLSSSGRSSPQIVEMSKTTMNGESSRRHSIVSNSSPLSVFQVPNTAPMMPVPMSMSMPMQISMPILNNGFPQQMSYAPNPMMMYNGIPQKMMYPNGMVYGMAPQTTGQPVTTKLTSTRVSSRVK